MIRTIDVGEITEHIRQMCIETNHRLSEDMSLSLKQAAETETSPLCLVSKEEKKEVRSLGTGVSKLKDRNAIII